MSNGYSFTDVDGDRLHVRPSASSAKTAMIETRGTDRESVYVKIPQDDAVEACLAILGASGVGDDNSTLRTAKRMLRRHLRDVEAAKKAAEEAERAQAAAQAAQDELDALAWTLYKAHWGITGSSQDGFVVASPGQAQERDRWRKVAAASREALVSQDSAPDLPRFALVVAYKGLGRFVDGVLDRTGDRVAEFGAKSTARIAFPQIEADPERWAWTPVSEYVRIEESK